MSTARSRAATLLLVAAVLLYAFDLRAPIVGVSAVVDAIRSDLGVDSATAGLLTSLPVLCFGVAAPLASMLLGRWGTRIGVLVSLVALLVGLGVRSLDGLPSAMAGTVLLGLAITIGNVAVPVVIGRDLPERAGTMLGLYTAAMNLGAMLTMTITAPLADVLGWRAALASWGVFVVVAAVTWILATRGPGAEDVPVVPPADGAAPVAWWRRPVVWATTAAFCGQASAYYGITAWLPLVLADLTGMSHAAAGVGSSVFQVSSLVGAFGVPVLLRLARRPLPVVGVVAAAWVTLPIGLLVAPQGWMVWSALGGAAQGGGFVVIFAMVLGSSRSPAENRKAGTLVQGVGYVAASVEPALIGFTHDASAGWTAPLLVVLGCLVLFGVSGAAAAVFAGRAAPVR